MYIISFESNIMNVDYKRTILFTTLWTLLGLFLLSVILWLTMFFFFPRTLGDFCYSLGLENMSANLYYKEYEKSGDISILHKSLNIEIKSKDYDKVIEYYEKFVDDDEYLEFMSAYKEHNEDLNIGMLEKSAMLNEENYLVNHYLTALIANGQTDEAFDIALLKFKDYKSFDLIDQGVYSFGMFLDSQDFDRMPDGYVLTIESSMQDYFNQAVVTFNENIETKNALEKSYLIALGNRIIEVGADLKVLYGENNQVLTEVNELTMKSINEKIKGLL